MKSSNIYLACGCALLLSACAAEAPFVGGEEKGKGTFAKSAINLKVQSDHVIKTKAGDEVVLDNVNVQFWDENDHLVDHYFYGHMPDVVVLDEGDYTVSAFYTHDGVDKMYPAAFDTPYYKGHSDQFKIQANKVTSDIGTVRCELQNVMTSVVFDPSLKEAMSDDSYVELKINENSPNTLNFTTAEENGQRYGYFEIAGEQTLVATFHGKVNGAETAETKTVDNVSAGNHYRITFKLHDYKGESSGNSNAEVVVDASVTKTDVDGNISIVEVGADDNGLNENERPGEPEDPINPEQPAKGPQIIPNEGVIMNEAYEINADSKVELKIISSTGLTGFEVDIISPTLTMEELDAVELANHLNLATGEGTLIDENGNQVGEVKDLSVALAGLKFPIKDEVLGKKEVDFTITEFLGLLGKLGPGDHRFVLKISDSTGTTTDTLILRTK